jgi:hypothetical protein
VFLAPAGNEAIDVADDNLVVRPKRIVGAVLRELVLPVLRDARSFILTTRSGWGCHRHELMKLRR